MKFLSKKGKRTAVLSLAAVMTATALGAVCVLNFPVRKGNAVGFEKVDGTDWQITSDTRYSIAPSVVERTIVYNTEDGKQNMGYVMEIDGSSDKISFAAGYGYQELVDDDPVWGMKTLTEQVKLHEQRLPDEKIVGAVNAGPFFMSGGNGELGQPTGILVMNGVVWQDNRNNSPFLAVFSDGSYGFFDGTLTEVEAAQSARQGYAVTVKEAVGSFFWLLQNGELTAGAQEDVTNPRTVIGIKEDGTIVFFAVDGRQSPFSEGLSLKDTALYLKQLGCVNALNYDGGGSTTFMTRRAGENEGTIRNSPSDGFERAISTSLFVISTAKESGVLTNANVYPQNEYYTPGSEVKITVRGADDSGSPANFPEDPNAVSFHIVPEEGGANTGSVSDIAISGNTITAVYKPDPDYQGEVTIELLMNGNKLGSTVLGFFHPDLITFDMTNVAVDYNVDPENPVRYDFGLKAYYESKRVALQDDDIEWSRTVTSLRVNGIGQIEPESEEAKNYDIGSFEGLFFVSTGNWKISASGTITAKYRDSQKEELIKTVAVSLGLEPQVVLDGGDSDGIALEGYMDNLEWRNYGREARGSVELVDADDPEWSDIIRFGQRAFKLNYDFTHIGNSGAHQPDNTTDGSCFGFKKSFDIEGAPTKIGAWIYVPENTPNYWLRGAVGTPNWTTLDYTQQGVKGQTLNGINWTGWKYCEADLAKYAGTTIQITSGELIRFMICGATGNGLYYQDGTYCPPSERKGWILVDKIQLIYGTNTEDTVNPVIDTFQYSTDSAVFTNAEDGVTFSQSAITFRGMGSDTTQQSPFNTGIVRRSFSFDGVISDSSKIEERDGFDLYTMKFSDGLHSATYTVWDDNGNSASRTMYFSVNTGSDYPSAWIETGDALLGRTLEYKLYAKGEISSLTFTLNTGAYHIENVDFGDLKGTYSSAATINGNVHIFVISGISSLPQDGLCVTVSIGISETLQLGSLVTWQASCLLNPVEAEEGVVYGFRTPSTNSEVIAFYELDWDIEEMIVDWDSGALRVLDRNDQPAGGVKVHLVVNGEDHIIGTTDENGVLVYDEEWRRAFTSQQGTFSIYAVDSENNRSFPRNVTSYNRIGKDEEPIAYYAMFNAVEDATTQKSISWMSFIGENNAPASMDKIVIWRAGNEATAFTLTGENKLIVYASTLNANYVYNVHVTGLDSDTEYCYRLGDGEKWSEPATFRTAAALQLSTNFFVVGDMQSAGDAEIAATMSEVIRNSGVDHQFGIQTGDAVDNPSSYTDWDRVLKIFSSNIWGKTNMIHVVGNHEVYGTDPEAEIYRTIFDVPMNKAGGYYSYTYGEVYVAVFGYTLNYNEMEEFGLWLKEDAAKSEAAWKIVVCHVPPFGTNPTPTVTDAYAVRMDELLGEAGIDFVFSGNDHAYARSFPMKNGQISDSGVVYYIVGTLGDKKYACVNDGRFVTATQDYNSIYISVTATAQNITVTAYDVLKNGTASVFDSYSKGVDQEACEHEYTYYRSLGLLKCNKCGLIRRPEFFQGLVTDYDSGNVAYLQGEQYFTGAIDVDEVWYYFGENGLGLDGEYEMCGYKTSFTRGVFVPAGEILNAGLAGEHAHFVILADGTFMLGGSGATYDFTSIQIRPWGAIDTVVKKIVIGKDITAIGERAFHNVPNVSQLVFEEDSKLESIGELAFMELGRDTDGVADICLPDSLKSIGGEAFRGIRVHGIYLPDGLVHIEANAFMWAYRVSVNVLEGSYAHEKAVEYGVKFTTRKYLMTDSFSEDFTGILIVKTDGQDVSVYYYKNGALAESRTDRFTALSAAAELYNAMDAESRAAHADDYAALKDLLIEYNKTSGEINQAQDEATKAATK